MDKPDVDYIDGLSPAVSIDQKATSHNPRSTVGTVTEIYDYLRLLFARVGIPHCPICGREVVKTICPGNRGYASKNCRRARKYLILAPIVRARKGTYQAVLMRFARPGLSACGWMAGVSTWMREIKLERYKIHTIEAVVDRLVINPPEQRGR